MGYNSYILLFPFIWLLAKSSEMAMQSVLHALFLPTPFKRTLAQLSASAHATADLLAESANQSPDMGQVRLTADSFTEVLKPGALYRECSVVTLPLPPLPDAPVDDEPNDAPKNTEKPKAKKGKAKETSSKPDTEHLLEIEDDGEYGGEGIGRVVWEWFENHLKMWEAKEKEMGREAKPPST